MVEFIWGVTQSEANCQKFNLTRVAPLFKGNPPNRRYDMMSGVFVNAYERVRFGRVEHVCAHWRSR